MRCEMTSRYSLRGHYGSASAANQTEKDLRFFSRSPPFDWLSFRLEIKGRRKTSRKANHVEMSSKQRLNRGILLLVW
jgi:hypothetical protein